MTAKVIDDDISQYHPVISILLWLCGHNNNNLNVNRDCNISYTSDVSSRDSAGNICNDWKDYQRNISNSSSNTNITSTNRAKSIDSILLPSSIIRNIHKHESMHFDSDSNSSSSSHYVEDTTTSPANNWGFFSTLQTPPIEEKHTGTAR